MSRFFRRTNLFIAFALLAANCDGKSGLPGDDPHPQAGPLTIVAVTPEDGATGVAPDASVSVVFSRAIATPASGALSLRGPAGALGGVVAVSGSTLTFHTTELAEPGASLTATLDAGVVATDGGDPAPAKSWHFSLRSERQWLTETLAPGDSPRLALDDAGRIYAAWRAPAGGAVLASWTGAAGWEQTFLGPSARDASLAASADGAWALWADGARLLAMPSRDGIWQTTITVSEGAKRIAQPRLALLDGAPIAVWTQAGGEVFASGAGLTTPIALSAPGTLAFDPQISAAGGRAVAVWRESDGTRAWMAGASFSGGAWGGRTILSSATNDAYDPAVIVLGDGALATWSQRRSGGSTPAPSLWYATLSAGGWSAAQVLLDPRVTGAVDVSGAGAGGITAPALFPDGAGGAWLTWQQRDGKSMSATNIAVLRAAHHGSGGFGPPITLDDGTNGDPAQAGASFEAAGNGSLVWQRGHASTTHLFVCGANGTAFDSPLPLGETGARQPRIAKAHGREVRLWRRADGILVVDRLD